MEKKYYKDLDIIRLIACISIFLYHLNILKGGYLAVCTFFVLSGYLSCISAFRKEKFSFRSYYCNRLLKIYLPLLVVSFITISVVYFIPNFNWLNLKPETKSVLLGYNNFWQLSANLDYFARHINSPFMHLWYISILLQFDLVFPFIYVILRKIGDKFNKIIPCIIMGVLSIIFLIFFYKNALTDNIMMTYYNTFTRIFSLLFGMCLGFIHSYYNLLISKRSNNRIVFYWYILVLILLFIFIDAKSVLFPIGMIVTTLITCRLIDYGTINSKVKLSILGKIIKFLSSISYEIYLIQYPIIFLFLYVNINIYIKTLIIIFLVIVFSYILHICTNFKKGHEKYAILKYLIRIIVLFITLFGISRFYLSKDYTKEMKQLEEHLSQNNELMSQKQKEYESKLKQEEQDWLSTLNDLKNGENEIRSVVSNLSIVGIGDSIMLGSVKKLYETFPNGYFDAAISRTAWKANYILQSLKNRNMLGDIVVLNLGANGDCTYSCKVEILKTCEGREIFWVNITNDRSIKFNDKLISLANEYSNLHIIDWNSISSGHPEYFIQDGIHLTDKGINAYTNAIYDAIYQLYLKKYNEKKNEIIKNHEEEQKTKISFYGNDILLGAFNYLEKDFTNSKFNINKEFNYEVLKQTIEKSIEDNSITKRLVFAFDNTINLGLDEYKELIELCKNNEIYILSTNEQIINNLYNLNYENVKVIDFYKEIQSNNTYLMADKIHLTDVGNKALSKILKDTIK